MISQPFRRVAGLLVVGVIGLGLTGCSNKTSDAATITYHDTSGEQTIHISRSEFTQQLGELVGNARFQQLLKTNGFPEAGDQENSTSAEISASYLSQLVQQAAVDAEYQSLGLKVTDGQRTQAGTVTKTNFGADVFAGFPKSLQNVLIEQQARGAAVGAYFTAMTDAKEQALYEQFKGTLCPSGREVSHILVKDLATANAIEAQLKDGASFGDLARTKSTDTASAKLDGSLGCLQKGAFVKEFEDAALAAEFDKVTAPVKSEFGYHVILVTKPSYAAIRAQLAQALQQSPLVLVQALRMQEMKVWINPQFGTGAIVQNSQSGQLSYKVTPPLVPKPRTEREKSSTTTASTPLLGG